MKKPLAAIAAGLTLVAGQAVAQSAASNAAPAVTDRLGSESSGEFMASGVGGAVFAIAFVAGFAGLMASSEDDSESD